MTRLVCCAGTTRTALVDGISAAGADADAMAHTPSADAEILAYGRPVRAPVVPVSPTGCPTPAVVTRAVLERLGVDCTVVDAGLAEPTGAPTVTVGARAGDDIREQDPVPSAPGAFAAARQFGRKLPDDELFLAETVPGGTTTALGVLTALGDEDVLGGEARGAVSSSLPENPLDLKRRIVAEALEASTLEPGDAAGEPLVALRRAGDPVLAVLSGIAAGALETDTAVTLAGGTQLVAAAACLRHGGYDSRLSLATTSFVAEDPAVDLDRAAAELDLSVTATDPGFTDDHPATAAYLRGEAKEGVGMGGALALADRAGFPMAEVRDGVREVYDDLLADDQREAPRP
ncbi:nicotinate-nucleotide--dimethylbenzimidazole phosphoribosyltransferase [Natronomonas salina]|uniref:nicotinate-nucleotide--dimethylbenzimidazole phosphoribosyltransferase n=1 Tax=Natronomonas salina TaxID=1710540 RepID=UPI0015B54940|nr:nicotinate-nucleotide--dimethylbenzimidazole phosphoribosyltransferase [Natronomonas salina]QLD89832.1 nicotinate-nucleotide--dimethylbenzimidazole phosphoribosyltransferase [Natronomonas salina]